MKKDIELLCKILFGIKNNNPIVKKPKPFVKWVGGKTKLINDIVAKFPSNKFNTYIEPFVGGGALLFHVLNNYPEIENVIINDLNEDLINCYRTIKYYVFDLIGILEIYQTEYHNFSDEEKRKKYYYEKRTLFNTRSVSDIRQAALFIFLNKTCFNGLYRVNKKNGFNTSMGSNKTPLICDRENLLNVNRILQRVIILNGDFEHTIEYVTENTIFYFDPPYKPTSKTSNFDSYTKVGFDDTEQIRLKEFCDLLHSKGHKWVLSNSNNNFFLDLYRNYDINRILCVPNSNFFIKDKKMKELLINN